MVEEKVRLVLFRDRTSACLPLAISLELQLQLRTLISPHHTSLHLDLSLTQISAYVELGCDSRPSPYTYPPSTSENRSVTSDLPAASAVKTRTGTSNNLTIVGGCKSQLRYQAYDIHPGRWRDSVSVLDHDIQGKTRRPWQRYVLYLPCGAERVIMSGLPAAAQASLQV